MDLNKFFRKEIEYHNKLQRFFGMEYRITNMTRYKITMVFVYLFVIIIILISMFGGY